MNAKDQAAVVEREAHDGDVNKEEIKNNYNRRQERWSREKRNGGSLQGKIGFFPDEQLSAKQFAFPLNRP